MQLNYVRQYIEFLTAILSGLMLSFYSQYSISFIKPMWSNIDDFKFTVIYIVVFLFVALIVFPWKNKIKWNASWVIIAILGSTLCASVDELFAWSDSYGVLRDYIMLPIGIVIYSIISLPVMALSVLLQKIRFK